MGIYDRTDVEDFVRPLTVVVNELFDLRLAFFALVRGFLELSKSLNLLENTPPKSYEKLRKQKQR